MTKDQRIYIVFLLDGLYCVQLIYSIWFSPAGNAEERVCVYAVEVSYVRMLLQLLTAVMVEPGV